MAFLPQFEHEVFLSYGWGDNSDATQGDRAWVARFKELLEREISDNLPRAVRLYFDIEQSHNGDVPVNLELAARSSAIFLAVVTENSCRQESWCRKEHAWFLKHAIDPVNRDLQQIFAIRIRDVDRSLWPANLNPYDFTYPQGPRRFQYDSKLLADHTQPAGILLQRVALDISEELKRIEAQIQKTDLIAETSKGLQPTAATLVREAAYNKRFAIQSNEIAAHSQGDAEQELAHLLRWSSRSVHLVDEEFDQPAAGWDLSLQAWQLVRAQARFQGEQRAITVWKKPGALSPAFDKLASIAPEAAIPENLPINETQPFLVAPKGEPESRPSTGTRYVYVQCTEQDRSVVSQLRSYFPKTVFLRPPNFDGPKPGRNRMNRELAERCHGVAVYYGNRKEYDAWNACNNITAALGSRTGVVPQVVLIHPASDEHLDFIHPNFERIPWEDPQTAPPQLSTFVNRVLSVPL